MKEREDKRVARTRAAIRSALIEVAGEKGLEHVTVTDIARRAGINRKTFYVYYNSIDDLVGQLEREIAGRLHPLIKKTNLTVESFDTYHFFGQFSTYLSADMETFHLFNRAGLLPHLLETIKASLIDTFLAQFDGEDPLWHAQCRLYAEYTGAALLGSFSYWIATQEVPLEEYANTIGRVTLAGFRSIYRGPFPPVARQEGD